uniref:Putative AC transposase n=1 Tax=Tanacetum cinerariifolium TaxID=118510 RepID=A0A699HU54_TANCI|nr:putative AC transposase [Tanacetum cinerariifolium]
MAINVLSAQAISVASEYAFSTSRRALSIRRTKLTPSSLKMCMCLKDHLDAQERKQHTSTLENTLDFKDGVLDTDVQGNEATPLSDEEIALDAASQGTMASVKIQIRNIRSGHDFLFRRAEGGGALGSSGALKPSTHPVIAILLYPLGAEVEATCALEVEAMRALDLTEALDLMDVEAVGDLDLEEEALDGVCKWKQ